VKVRKLAQADNVVMRMLELRFAPESWRAMQIKAFIDAAEGDITQALRLAVGQGLGGWGRSWEGGWIQAMLAAPANPIEIWKGSFFDTEGNGLEPDYKVAWRVVFEFVAGKPHQAKLF
jgi:hypothetical protein